MKRSSGSARRKLNLDLMHHLMLEEFVGLIGKDDHSRKQLGFADEARFERLFKNVNQNVRRKVMHPTRPLLSDTFGIEELRRYAQQVTGLIALLRTETATYADL